MGSLLYLNEKGHVKTEWDLKTKVGTLTIPGEDVVEMNARAAVKQAEEYIAEAKKRNWPMFNVKTGDQVQTIKDKTADYAILRPIAGGRF